MKKLFTALISLGVAVGAVVFLNIILVEGCDTARPRLLINILAEERAFFSELGFMWVFICLGFGELFLRFRTSSREIHQIHSKIFSEDEAVVLTDKELLGGYKRTKKAGEAYLSRLIQRVVKPFLMSKSSEQANSVMDSSLELFLHEVDLRYEHAALHYVGAAYDWLHWHSTWDRSRLESGCSRISRGACGRLALSSFHGFFGSILHPLTQLGDLCNTRFNDARLLKLGRRGSQQTR